ncbi:DUF732 domain-containing protein [Mycolicibacterium mengxianglii]|uniref:DUF732 domain-containing protein n=1 Tax=Mycolicibacterium mengxianglii TaxID=2736649 RepID=UPI0018D1BBBE|nr:DUF732 domain-containing protein [Mycolicibacterium mengxianglii]
MKLARIAAVAVSVGLMGGAAIVAAPAQADPAPDAFLNALSTAGVTGLDPATAVSVGQSVCPMLSEPGQQMADVAANVSDAIGRPLGPATMFTGVAISLFCPGAVAAVGDRIAHPVILPMLGF